MSLIAIITARGGSKRIPRKNIKEFCGKPIIAYPIDAAIKAGIFDTVMVSTDDDEIADIAKKYGAEVPFLRSEETSNDFATTADALREVLVEYSRREKRFENVCCIYPTAVFVTKEKLINAYKLMETGVADSVMPVVRYGFSPQRAMYIRGGKLEYIHPEFQRVRSQDLEPVYHDAGQFYFYRVCEDLKFDVMNPAPLIVSELEVQDIDNETDWKIAEIKYKLMNSSN